MSLLFHGIKDKKTLLKQLKAISWATALMLLIGQFYPMKTPYIQENKSKVALEPWKNRFWIDGIDGGIVFYIFVIFISLSKTAFLQIQKGCLTEK